MIRAACHCGAVRLTVDPEPKWVNDCNCSICRRYGVLWAYAFKGEATLVQGGDGLETYVWGRGIYGLHRCRDCGCLTHVTENREPDRVQGVNARMFVDFDPQRVRIHRTDNAHTGRFWTRPDEPIVVGGHPPMPPPGDDSWL